jgi:hypothetical protein
MTGRKNWRKKEGEMKKSTENIYTRKGGKEIRGRNQQKDI